MIQNTLMRTKTVTKPVQPTWYWMTQELGAYYWAGTPYTHGDPIYITDVPLYLQNTSQFPHLFTQYSMITIHAGNSNRTSDASIIDSEGHDPMVILPYRGLQGKVQDFTYAYREDGTTSHTYTGPIFVPNNGELSYKLAKFTFSFPGGGRDLTMRCTVDGNLCYWKVQKYGYNYSVIPFYASIQ